MVQVERRACCKPSKTFPRGKKSPIPWNLFASIRQKGRESHSELAQHNWDEVREALGNAIGLRFENALREFWRITPPPLWAARKLDERGNSFWQTVPSANRPPTGIQNRRVGWPALHCRSSACQRMGHARTEWFSTLAARTGDRAPGDRSSRVGKSVAGRNFASVQHWRIRMFCRQYGMTIRVFAGVFFHFSVSFCRNGRLRPDVVTQASGHNLLLKCWRIVALESPNDPWLADLSEKRFATDPSAATALGFLSAVFRFDVERGTSGDGKGAWPHAKGGPLRSRYQMVWWAL